MCTRDLIYEGKLVQNARKYIMKSLLKIKFSAYSFIIASHHLAALVTYSF